jgi:osomolarity two-component system sensor histidine kinase SLN1
MTTIMDRKCRPTSMNLFYQTITYSLTFLRHLLNDLLTFSKNQIGQQLSLEEREFRLVDIKTQILTIFIKQVQEKKIDFSVKFIGTDAEQNSEQGVLGKALPALGPAGMGRLKDLCLWGDQHRILQVIINLVSNSLKFTPESGKVQVRIKCLGEETPSDGSRNSMGSKQSSQRTSRNRTRNDSGSNTSQVSRKPSNSGSKGSNIGGTALMINPMDPKATPRVHIGERAPTPPPASARVYTFQFEVEDTGPGIPEDQLERIFEPFVQGDLGLSKKYGGTGLGLSICSQLATTMGGSISLDSTEGVGSTFTMRIPLKHTKSRAPSTSSSEVHSVRNSSEGNRVSSPKLQGTASPQSGSTFEKDTQPRLVGLSQPFFASAPTASNGPDTKEQLAALDTVAAAKAPGPKLRVLVAEDNLVNQVCVHSPRAHYQTEYNPNISTGSRYSNA